jgi:cell division septation protein DedD
VAFNLYRATTATGPWDTVIDCQPARGDAVTGARYSYRDTLVVPGIRYYYLLEEITVDGPGERFGPVSAEIGLPPEPTSTPTATPTATEASSTSTPTPTVTPTVTKRSLFLPVIIRQ